MTIDSDGERRDDAADEIDEPRTPPSWWLATAAMLFLALWGWREVGIRVLRERVRSQAAEIKQLSERDRALAQQRDRIANGMAMLTTATLKPIVLAGQPSAPGASGRLFIDAEKRTGIAFFADLPENQRDRSYQLWIMRTDQPAPQSAGVFDIVNGHAALTIQTVPDPAQISAFAVTLERRGGAAQPTSSDFYVTGTM